MPRTILSFRMHLALCLRVTVAAVLTFWVGRLIGLPLILWAVLTSVILTQMSVGKSLKAIIDYFMGTLGGSIYAGCVAAFVPHTDDTAVSVVLALAIAPLALLAAISPRFAVAPSTAVIVVLAPSLTHATSIASATERVIEVALGGVVALFVSLVVFPARARVLLKDAGATMLDEVAQKIPILFAGLTQSVDSEWIKSVQRNVGSAFSRFESMIAEAEHERMSLLTNDPEFTHLRVALLRLRHDVVMIGRAAVRPLPQTSRGRIEPLLARISQAAVEYLKGCATALRRDAQAPALELLDSAFDSLAEQLGGMRADGSFRGLDVETLERIFAMAFALEQLRRDLQDLSRRVNEQCRKPAFSSH